MRRPLVIALGLVLGLGLTGCATIPTSGPVVTETRRAAEAGPGGILVEPDPPLQGALPNMIVRGFLTAMASSDIGFATARGYLTQAAAAAWHPETADVIVYASSTALSVVGDHVSIQGALIGTLSPEGSFTAAAEPVWNHDFGLVKENGEWRISSPPPGLAVSQFMFLQTYTPVDVFFYPAADGPLVPDTRYIRLSDWNPTRAAALVLGTPSAWLGPLIDTSLWAEVSLVGEVTLGSTGVAEVPLTSAARALTPADTTRLAIAIAATMRPLAGVNGVRLLVGGVPLAVKGVQDSWVPVSLADAQDPVRSSAPANLFAVQDGRVVTVSGSAATALAGDWGTTGRAITALAVSHDQGLIAAVTDEGLLVGAPTAAPTLVAKGETWGWPQFDKRGNLWAASSDPATAPSTDENAVPAETSLSVVTADGPVPVDTSALGGEAIQGFALSPDGDRIALILRVDLPEGSSQQVGVARVTHSGATPVAITGWKPVRPIWEAGSLTSVLDVAWAGQSSLVVLGRSGTAPPGITFTNLDGLQTEDGALPRDWAPVELAARPTAAGAQIAVKEEDGTVWSYDGAWHLVTTGLSVIAYPD